ncbi:MAG TPA: DMT family transporter [Stellaceae bacterium]|nr:DMT family transporter [Stellaceae bacterium]
MSDASIPRAADDRVQAAAHLGTIFTMFAWGTLIPVTGVVLREVDAWTLALLRIGVAAAVLLASTTCLGGVSWLRRVRWERALLMGGAVASFSVLYTFGIGLSNPISAIVVSATSPAVAALFATCVERQPLPRGAISAFALATAGALIASLSSTFDPSRAGLRGGEFLLLIAGICWTWYSIKAQAWFGSLGQHRITALAYLGATGVLGTLYPLLLLAQIAAVPPALPSTTTIGWIVWITFAATLAGGVLWNYGVSRIGIILVSLYLNLIPLFGILTAVAFGVYPSWLQVAGCILVVVGVSRLRGARVVEATESARK